MKNKFLYIKLAFCHVILLFIMSCKTYDIPFEKDYIYLGGKYNEEKVKNEERCYVSTYFFKNDKVGKLNGKYRIKLSLNRIEYASFIDGKKYGKYYVYSKVYDKKIKKEFGEYLLAEEGYYKNGVKDSISTEYYGPKKIDGQLNYHTIIKTTYKEGVANGDYEHFRDGKLKLKSYLKNSVKDNIEYLYDNKGTIIQEVSYYFYVNSSSDYKVSNFPIDYNPEFLESHIVDFFQDYTIDGILIMEGKNKKNHFYELQKNEIFSWFPFYSFSDISTGNCTSPYRVVIIDADTYKKELYLLGNNGYPTHIGTINFTFDSLLNIQWKEMVKNIKTP